MFSRFRKKTFNSVLIGDQNLKWIKINFCDFWTNFNKFDNCEQPGYTTEKLVQPMLVYSLPIYWGNPFIDEDFNTHSFLSYYNFDFEDELIEKIVELDRNNDLYLEYLRQPYYKNNEINKFVNQDNILHQFRHIFEQSACE